MSDDDVIQLLVHPNQYPKWMFWSGTPGTCVLCEYRSVRNARSDFCDTCFTELLAPRRTSRSLSQVTYL